MAPVAHTVRAYFICLECEERRFKDVGAKNGFLATNVVELCKKGHAMKLDRTENR
jgi:hypothetical protein